MPSIEPGVSATSGAIAINLVLALVKVSTGVLGNSYALIADGIESTTDVFSSLIVRHGLQVSARPPDEEHPYGYGKAESLAGLIVSLFLIGTSIMIAVQSVFEILTPHHAPAWYTLLVLALVIITKEGLYRFMYRVGDSLGSSALRNDAWHHRSDAVTSMAAFLGISIALIGGPGYETADDWAALIACSVILFTGVRLLRSAAKEMLDAAAPRDVEGRIRKIASAVPGVVAIEKCRVRKSGLGYLMDIHVVVDGSISVRKGHDIGHAVKDALMQSDLPICDAVLHVEPD